TRAATFFDGPGVALVRDGVQETRGGRPGDGGQLVFGERGGLFDRSDAVAVQFGGRGWADAPQSFDREGEKKGVLLVGRDDEQTVGFGETTGDLGEKLGAGDSDGDRQTHLSAHVV